MEIAQLQVTTAYSLLASTIRIDELVKTAKERGFTSLAITDLNVMSGVAEFYQACQKQQIKPLIGLTIEYRESTQEDQDVRLILLAKNQLGYQNLLKISTAKMELEPTEHYYYKQFQEHLHDLVVIIPDEQSTIATLYQEQRTEQLNQTLANLKQQVDDDSLFGGVSLYEEEPRKQHWLKVLASHQIKEVALEDVRYLNPSDDFSLKVLRHIDEGTRIGPEHIQQAGHYFLSTAADLEDKYEKNQLISALANTQKITALCQFEMMFHQTLLPHFDVPKGETAASYLRKICQENLPQRVKNPDQRYLDRLELELSTISDMGFDDYFLIIWDVMKFAAEQKIVMGPGRGSAAGSLVSFVTSITEVDPIEYDLLFERFLNKERYTMPDIDLDIPDNRRDEVLHYVSQKYGHHQVAQIATFGTMAAKMALRDVCRVFGLSQNEANQWSGAVPSVLKITLEEAFKQSHKLQQLVEDSERNKLIFEVAVKIEGLPRHVSTHAAGVVISDQDLTSLVALQLGSNQIPLTQFTMGDVEAIGLLKMDFLGLRNLSILDDTIQQIKRVYKEEIILKDLPMDDKKTLDIFYKAQTVGIFQFESAGIKNVLRKLGPTSIEDVAAVNALYRPGPMDNIDLFISRKKGEVPVDYPHPNLQEILDVTYGVIVYQEQIMQVVSKMAGFSYGEADILRRAISKKEKTVLDEQRRHFVEGSLNLGYSEGVANQVYDYIERFANYGFNRSHAMAYSFIAYQMAYLKVHYPAPFFASLLHSVRHNLGKIKEYITEAKRFGLKVKGPDINQSRYSFFLEKNAILFGFSSLKGIRKDFIRNVLDVRKADGPYKSLDNFLLRIDRKWLKEDNILPLIYIGAFDSLHGNRKQLVVDLEGMIKNISFSGGSLDLLSILSLKKETVSDYSIEEKLDQEETYLGTYLSGHPVDEYQTLRIVKNARSIDQVEIGKRGSILVYSRQIRVIRTKKGEQMAFIEGNDSTAEISVTIFPQLYRKIGNDLHENKVYFVEGKVERSTYNQALQIIGETVVLAESFKESIGSKICYLKISRGQETRDVLDRIKETLEKHPGNNPVIIFDEQSAQKIALSDEFWVKETVELKNKLSYLVDKQNIIFR
ncbi:DNA polymerase III subunit alpha [uncultured Vagococcus sp.]|uniref:DNA polymerase III subunit alpha n=1 Tax=uncultured Vagococcus sp. TaxID=189676 RepID=UPI0028D08615|nr:DNA polymerase III subunit alpha [uncultured Vagococcus sp.]